MTAEERRAAFAQRSRASGGLVALDDRGFAELVAGTPRQHHTVVLATTHRSVCTACGQAADEFELLATSYAVAKAGDREGKMKDVFFAVIFDSNARTVLHKLHVTRVPMVLHFGPALTSPAATAAAATAAAAGADADYGPFDEMRLPKVVTAEALEGFVRQRTGVSIPIRRSQLGVILFVAAVLALLVLSIRPLVNRMDLILKAVRTKVPWMTLSAAFYFVSVSGGVFDIIRSPPLFHSQGGQTAFFHPHSNQQFVIEGFVLGGLNFAAGACVVGLAEWAVH
ncbi:unnamed protein product, partial [Phaeothamnion confervicola]